MKTIFYVKICEIVWGRHRLTDVTFSSAFVSRSMEQSPLESNSRPTNQGTSYASEILKLITVLTAARYWCLS
jgi:hypothetical protein